MWPWKITYSNEAQKKKKKLSGGGGISVMYLNFIATLCLLPYLMMLEAFGRFESFFSSSEQFDEFQLAILNYFDAFFERMAIENKPKPMAV